MSACLKSLIHSNIHRVQKYLIKKEKHLTFYGIIVTFILMMLIDRLRRAN